MFHVTSVEWVREGRSRERSLARQHNARQRHALPGLSALRKRSYGAETYRFWHGRFVATLAETAWPSDDPETGVKDLTRAE